MPTRSKAVTAIELLEDQHREVEALFAQIEGDADDDTAETFALLADTLAIHTRIEELHFYPAVRAKKTEELVVEAYEEHLEAKKLLVELLEMDVDSDEFVAGCTALRESIEHHVHEEENELFPKVKKLLSNDELVSLAKKMTATQRELEATQPRFQVGAEIAAAETEIRGGSEEVRVPLMEEEIAAEKRVREAGSVVVRKKTRTERKQIEVPVVREEVEVERRRVDQPVEADSASFDDEVLRVPIREEEVVVTKRPVVREELRVRRTAEVEQRVAEASVRRQEAEVEETDAETETETETVAEDEGDARR